MYVNGVQNDGCNQKIETVLDEVVDDHRDVSQYSPCTDYRPNPQRTDGDAYQAILRGSTTGVGDEADEKEDTSTDASNEDDHKQRNRSFDPPFSGL